MIRKSFLLKVFPQTKNPTNVGGETCPFVPL